MKIRINISSETVVKPIIAESILETGVLLNVSQAFLDRYSGEVIADLPEEQFDKIYKALTSRGACVTRLDSPIGLDQEECIECGACISVCPTQVFSMDENYNLHLDTIKCIQCGTCVEMCPHRALALIDSK